MLKSNSLGAMILGTIVGLSVSAQAGSVNDGFVAGSSAYVAGYSTSTYSFSNFSAFGAGNYTSAFAGQSGLTGYSVQQQYYVPAVVANTSGSAMSFPAIGVTQSMAVNELLLHPGNVANPTDVGNTANTAVLRYTYTGPTDIFSISGRFLGLGSTTTVSGVYLNGNALDIGGVSGTGSNPFSSQQTLSSGDIIDFVVGSPGSDFGSDSTGLVANIAAVPLPPAVLAGGGLMGAVAFVRRLRRRAV